MHQEWEGMQETTMASGAAGAIVSAAAGGGVGMIGSGLIGIVAGIFLSLGIAKSKVLQNLTRHKNSKSR